MHQNAGAALDGVGDSADIATIAVADLGLQAIESAKQIKDLLAAVSATSGFVPPSNVPPADIPHFAAGGMVTKPTLAIVGEVPELIIPLSKLPQGGAARGGTSFAEDPDAPAINIDFSGAIIGDPYQTAQLLGEAVGIALRENYGSATTGAKEGLETRT